MNHQKTTTQWIAKIQPGLMFTGNKKRLVRVDLKFWGIHRTLDAGFSFKTDAKYGVSLVESILLKYPGQVKDDNSKNSNHIQLKH
jgi:hypothetical protein